MRRREKKENAPNSQTKKERSKMDKELKEYLRDGEIIRWSGRSAPFPLLDQREKGRILIRWAITLVCISMLLGIYGTRSGALSGKFIALVTVVAALVLAQPWLERRSVMGLTYVITDQRAVLLTRDKSVYYMELDEVDDVRRLNLNSGADALVLGSAVFEEARRQLRFRACHPKTDLQSAEGLGRATGLVFYGVRDADAAETLLREPAEARLIAMDERAAAM